MHLARGMGASIFYFLLHPIHYPLSSSLETMARSADVLALGGSLLAALLALWMLRARPQDPMAIAAGLFAALIFVLPFVWPDPNTWKDINAYGRFLSPLLILVALPPMTRTSRLWWLGLAPVTLVDLRLGMQFASTAAGVLRKLF
jgi:hypothetical protein